MTTCSIASIASVLLPAALHAAPGATTPAFAELLKNGTITLTGTGLGRHMGESVSVVVRDASGRGVRNAIPAGWVLQAGDAGVQDLMLVRIEPFDIAPGGSVTVSCRAFCVEANDAGPGEGAVFLAGRLAAPRLVELAEFINTGQYPDDAVLFAVWATTGDRPLSSVRSDDMQAIAPLRRKVAELTGQTIPWYSVSYEDEPREDGYFSAEPATINGAFDFSMANNGVVRIFVTDADGNVLREMGRERHLGPGSYSMEVALTINGWRRGRYAIKAYEGGTNLIKRIDFEI